MAAMFAASFADALTGPSWLPLLSRGGEELLEACEAASAGAEAKRAPAPALASASSSSSHRSSRAPLVSKGSSGGSSLGQRRREKVGEREISGGEISGGEITRERVRGDVLHFLRESF